MEFADGGIAGLQHLHVQLGGDGLQRVGIEARGKAVHRLAPGPERIIRVGLALGHARHCALERVRMQVRDAGHDPPAACGRFGGFHRGDTAPPVDRKAGIGAPAVRSPQHRGIKGLHGGILACAMR
jgi:hypothetical protein